MEALELKKKKNPYENILYPHSRILKEIVCGRKRDKERLIQGTVQSLLLLVSLTQKSSSCTRRPVCFNVGHRKKNNWMLDQQLTMYAKNQRAETWAGTTL